ncbi:MAG: hypothetical protein MHPSP_001583 [Paramarteilia canceri]
MVVEAPGLNVDAKKSVLASNRELREQNRRLLEQIRDQEQLLTVTNRTTYEKEISLLKNKLAQAEVRNVDLKYKLQESLNKLSKVSILENKVKDKDKHMNVCLKVYQNKILNLKNEIKSSKNNQKTDIKHQMENNVMHVATQTSSNSKNIGKREINLNSISYKHVYDAQSALIIFANDFRLLKFDDQKFELSNPYYTVLIV